MSRPIAAVDPEVTRRRRRRTRHAAWTATVVCFIGGLWIGWYVHPEVGAALWIASAVLAFVPFLSHRHRM